MIDDDLRRALIALNNAAHAAVRAGLRAEGFSRLDDLKRIARQTDDLVDNS